MNVKLLKLIWPTNWSLKNWRMYPFFFTSTVKLCLTTLRARSINFILCQRLLLFGSIITIYEKILSNFYLNNSNWGRILTSISKRKKFISVRPNKNYLFISLATFAESHRRSLVGLSLQGPVINKKKLKNNNQNPTYPVSQSSTQLIFTQWHTRRETKRTGAIGNRCNASNHQQVFFLFFREKKRVVIF